MNSLAASKEQLTDSLHQLFANWHTAKEVWNDAARQDFEKEFVSEFETTTVGSM